MCLAVSYARRLGLFLAKVSTIMTCAFRWLIALLLVCASGLLIPILPQDEAKLELLFDAIVSSSDDDTTMQQQTLIAAILEQAKPHITSEKNFQNGFFMTCTIAIKNSISADRCNITCDPDFGNTNQVDDTCADYNDVAKRAKQTSLHCVC